MIFKHTGQTKRCVDPFIRPPACTYIYNSTCQREQLSLSFRRTKLFTLFSVFLQFETVGTTVWTVCISVQTNTDRVTHEFDTYGGLKAPFPPTHALTPWATIIFHSRTHVPTIYGHIVSSFF